MHQVTEVEPNVDLFQFNSRQAYIVGTAHVSRASADLVEKVIRERQPDLVCIELCEPRYHSLRNPNRWEETDIFEILRSGKTYVLMAQLALAAFQKRVAKKFGVVPGEEMIRAMKIADELNIPVEVIDRDVKITLRRAWASASVWSLIKLFFSLLISTFSAEDISEDEIEELKHGDALSALMAEFSGQLPGVKDALIDERDRYMSAKIASAPGNNMVVIVGAGHVPGMRQAFSDDIDVAALETIPPMRRIFVYLGWGFPLAILGLIAYGFASAGSEIGAKMILAWVLANGTLSSLGALLAFAHPLTIVTAFFAAPITSLNPMIAAGWVCGLVEAFLRKPRVKDLQTISEDITSVKGLFKNRVTHILMVIAFANLGSVVGTFLGAGWIASLFL